MRQPQWAAFLTAAALSMIAVSNPASAAQPLDPDDVTARDVASLAAHISLDGAVHFSEPPIAHITRLTTTPDGTLSRLRRVCAVHAMGAIRAAVSAAAEKAAAQNAHVTVLPDVAPYCTAVIREARRRKVMSALYVDLALQEQGIPWYNNAGDASYLSNNEAGRSFQTILVAANAGQSSYVAISGQTRDLFCPLALDAGATWASGNANASAPVELTAEEADAIARDCYEPTVKEITVRGATLPATKAGLILGVWLAKHP